MVQLVVLIATASAVRLIARVRASACFSSIRIGMEPTPNSLASSAILCRSSAKIRIHHPKHHALPGEFGAQGAEFHDGLLRDRATICGKEEDNGFAIHLPQFVVFASIIEQAEIHHLLSLRSRFNCGFQPCAKGHNDCHADQESSHGSRLVQRLACFNPILGSFWTGALGLPRSRSSRSMQEESGLEPSSCRIASQRPLRPPAWSVWLFGKPKERFCRVDFTSGSA